MGKHNKPRRFSKADKAVLIGSTAIGMLFAGNGVANAAPDWDKLAACETGGTWTYPAAYPAGGDNGFQGGLQFKASTWAEFGGLEFAPTAGQATREQQIAIAEKVLATQGPNAWPKCSQEKVPGWWNSGVPSVVPPAVPQSSTAVVLPTNGAFTSGYGSRWGATHHGIDIANSVGTPIYAVANGEVISAGQAGGFGQWVRILHDSGNVTVYGHIDSYNVSVGQRVTAGEQIARMGNRGHSTGPHLHFEVWKGGTKEAGAPSVDPLAWLSGNGVNLDWSGVISIPSVPVPEPVNSEVIPDAVPTGNTGGVIEVRGDLAAKYEIGPGDTLGKIAFNFGVSVDGIINLNHQIVDPDLIFAGDVINLMP